MIGIESLSSPGFRLNLLMALLAISNLPAYRMGPEADCNCSGLQGRMRVIEAYEIIREGDTGVLFAQFPESVQWSIERFPNPDVIAHISTSTQGSALPPFIDSFEVTMTAVDRIQNPTEVTRYSGLQILPPGSIEVETGRSDEVVRGTVPAKGARIDIAAVPDDPGSPPETRTATVLVVFPVLRHFGEEVFLDPSGSEPPDLDWDTVAFVDSIGRWEFQFDVSEAPSFLAPSVERVSPAAVRADFSYADTLHWRIVLLDDGHPTTPFDDEAVCEVQEPIHVTATDGDRILQLTVAARIQGYFDKENPERSCPQPADFGN